MKETCTPSLGWEDSLEKEMATHSSILAWRIPWTEEPCGLQSMGLQESDMIWWLNNLTTVQRKGLQKAGGYLWQPKPHTWDCLPPKVPSLLFLPWSIIFKANFFLSHRLTLGSQFWQPLSWSFLVSNLFSIQLAFWKHIPPHPSSAWTSGWYRPPFPIVHLTV